MGERIQINESVDRARKWLLFHVAGAAAFIAATLYFGRHFPYLLVAVYLLARAMYYSYKSFAPKALVVITPTTLSMTGTTVPKESVAKFGVRVSARTAFKTFYVRTIDARELSVVEDLLPCSAEEVAEQLEKMWYSNRNVAS